MAFDYKKELAKAKIETDRMIAIERERWLRERTALELEQKRQREMQSAIVKEQERLAREQERQAVQLAKHEEMIAKLEFRLSEAERTIAYYEPSLKELKDQHELLTLKLKYYEQRGLSTGGTRRELEKVTDKLFKIETKVNKARFEKQQAEKKLSA